MKDYFDELDKEIDSLSAISQQKDDIINTHILFNEGLDWTTENLEREKKLANNFNKKSPKKTNNNKWNCWCWK